MTANFTTQSYDPQTVQAHVERTLERQEVNADVRAVFEESRTYRRRYQDAAAYERLVAARELDLPDHGFDPTAGHHASFRSPAEVEADEMKAAERVYWRTERLFDHVF